MRKQQCVMASGGPSVWLRPGAASGEETGVSISGGVVTIKAATNAIGGSANASPTVRSASVQCALHNAVALAVLLSRHWWQGITSTSNDSVCSSEAAAVTERNIIGHA